MGMRLKFWFTVCIFAAGNTRPVVCAVVQGHRVFWEGSHSTRVGNPCYDCVTDLWRTPRLVNK